MTRESKQAQALLRVFESLGVPLIGAVDELLAWQGGAADPNPEEAARRFSALLSASISAGTQMATRLAPRNQDEAEVVRLRAATLAGAMIAQHYVLSGSMPDDAFNRRLNSAFDSVLSLADSFPLLPGEEAGATDLVARRVEALTPFVAAVMRFPFGQEDSLVIRKLGEHLCDRASALADAFSGGQSHGGPDLYAERELAFLKGGAKLLARACEVEMDKLQHATANNPGTQPPAPDVLAEKIWQRFEDSLDVLRAVIGFMSEPSGRTQFTVPTPQPVEKKAVSPAPAAPKASENASADAPPGGFNPMAFFIKKDDNKGDTSGEAA